MNCSTPSATPLKPHRSHKKSQQKNVNPGKPETPTNRPFIKKEQHIQSLRDQSLREVVVDKFPAAAPTFPQQTPTSPQQASTSPQAPKSMSEAEKYWNHYAGEYDDEIASSIDEDNGTIKKLLRAASNQLMLDRNASNQDQDQGKQVIVCDYGCGPGYWIQTLSNVFEKWKKHGFDVSIVGLDISQKLVDLARKKLPKVRVEQANLEKLAEVQQALRIESGPVSFGVCANVLIAPSVSSRNKILTSIRATTRTGSIIVFVVPSLESALYCEWRWLKSGPAIENMDDDAIPHETGEDANNILTGCLPRDDVRTKHWIREEFEQTLRMNGFQMMQCEKAEYGWNMEFSEGDIPLHMQTPGPGPWDWCVVAEKTM